MVQYSSYDSVSRFTSTVFCRLFVTGQFCHQNILYVRERSVNAYLAFSNITLSFYLVSEVDEVEWSRLLPSIGL